MANDSSIASERGIVELEVLIPVRTCATSKLRDAYYYLGPLDPPGFA